MAGFLDMLRLPGAPALAPFVLDEHLNDLAHRRGVTPWHDAFEAATIQGPDGALHLDILDAGGDMTVLFVPGTNAYALLYGEFLTALGDRGVNVVGLDPRGHGRSGGARGSYTLGEIVDDIEAAATWARARFDTPLVLSGSSQGGIATLYYAAKDESLAGVICHNIADLDDPESVQCMRHPALGALIRPLMPHLAAYWPELPVPMLAYLDLEAEPVRGARSAAAILHDDPLTVPFVRLRALASLSKGPTPNVAERVHCPTLVLHAANDGIFPERYVRSVFERIAAPDKTMRVYPGLAHYMIADDVDAFIDDIAGFLAQLSAR